MGEFIKALKTLATRRWRAQIVYSDNVMTFTAVERRIYKINKDEQFKDYLAREEIRWS